MWVLYGAPSEQKAAAQGRVAQAVEAMEQFAVQVAEDRQAVAIIQRQELIDRCRCTDDRVRHDIVR